MNSMITKTCSHTSSASTCISLCKLSNDFNQTDSSIKCINQYWQQNNFPFPHLLWYDKTSLARTPNWYTFYSKTMKVPVMAGIPVLAACWYMPLQSPMSISPAYLLLAKVITMNVPTNRMARWLVGKYSGRGRVTAQGGMWSGPIHGIPFCDLFMVKVKFIMCYFLWQ